MDDENRFSYLLRTCPIYFYCYDDHYCYHYTYKSFYSLIEYRFLYITLFSLFFSSLYGAQPIHSSRLLSLFVCSPSLYLFSSLDDEIADMVDQDSFRYLFHGLCMNSSLLSLHLCGEFRFYRIVTGLFEKNLCSCFCSLPVCLSIDPFYFLLFFDWFRTHLLYYRLWHWFKGDSVSFRIIEDEFDPFVSRSHLWVSW